MVITAVNAVVPFEIFGINAPNQNIRIYTIKEGELDNDDIVHYFRGGDRNNNISNQQKDSKQIMADSKEETKVEVNTDTIDVSLSIANNQFIIDTIGFSKESLNAFIVKHGILHKFNTDAAEAIELAYADIIREIYCMKANNKLDEDTTLRIANSLHV